jgi:hypothetical protein
MTYKLTPEQTAPKLSVATVNGETWTLAEQNPPHDDCFLSGTALSDL